MSGSVEVGGFELETTTRLDDTSIVGGGVHVLGVGRSHAQFDETKRYKQA